jgi:hypothetical protein
MVRDRLLRVCVASLGLAALSALVHPAAAQNPAQILDSLRRRYQLPLLPSTEVAATASRFAPGHNTASQSAYGANFGDGFIGAGFAARTRSGNKSDGSVVAGFGLWNARDYVGVEVSVFSFSTIREGFLQNGALGVKLHRVLPRNVAFAVGGENLAGWGELDAPKTYYGVVSKVWRLRQREGDPFGSVTTNLGIGNGRFSPDFDSLMTTSDRGKIGVFGSVGLRVHESVTLIGDWGGQDLSIGVSVLPVRWVPLVITPAYADVLHRDNHKSTFLLGVALGFKFSQVRNIFLPPQR